MTDESYSFTAAKSRLEEIVTQVRKKDTSLEKSLDLLEEGVRLANVCTELIDHADWATAPGASAVQAQAESTAEEPAEATAETAVDAGAESAEHSAEADVESPESADAAAEPSDDDHRDAEPVGDVWSEDEAWSDEAEQDPSDGDDGHGD